MPKTAKARAVGLNHIALEVGDIEEALAFYGRLFEFTLRGKSEHAAFMRRRDLLQELQKGAQAWHRHMVNSLRHALIHGVSASRPGDLPLPGASAGVLSLVDDDTIELEIVTSRLALAIMDRASWEFADLRSRVATLEGRTELEAQDLLRAHVLARYVFEFSWNPSPLVPLLGTAAGAVLALAAGWWGLREVLTRPVVQTLRQAADL